MEGIMNKVLNIDSLMDQFASMAENDTSSGGDGEKTQKENLKFLCVLLRI